MKEGFNYYLINTTKELLTQARSELAVRVIPRLLECRFVFSITLSPYTTSYFGRHSAHLDKINTKAYNIKH